VEQKAEKCSGEDET